MEAEIKKIIEQYSTGEKIDPESQSVFEKAASRPNSVDIFGERSKKDVSAKDVFNCSPEVLDLIEEHCGPSVRTAAKNTAKKVKYKVTDYLNPANIVIGINALVIAALLVYMLVRPSGSKTDPAAPAAAAQTPAQPLSPSQQVEPDVASQLDKAASWALGQTLMQNQKYAEAYYVFEKLNNNLNTAIPANEYLSDLLQLKMALAMRHTENHEDISKYLTRSLQSSSPVVRALTNYNLMFIEMEKANYLNVRHYAYRTLALIDTLDGVFSPVIEDNCYFMLCEAVTREVMRIHNSQPELPGTKWSDELIPELIPIMEQSELTSFLQSSVYHLSEGAVTAKIDKTEHLSIGHQWSVICLDAPLEEVLAKFASFAGVNARWHDVEPKMHNTPVTMYLTNTSEQKIAETLTGAADLMTRFETKSLEVYCPREYTDLDQYKKLICSEAVSLWRRFLLRYRGDHRTANAHYALGIVQEFAGEPTFALGEYKIIRSQYPHSKVAPFALLNASNIKTDLHDYIGAAEDFREILIQYPDFKLIDQASLSLAEATMKAGLYDDAIRMFQKAYNVDINPESQRKAAYGMGTSYYMAKEYELAKKWLAISIQLINNSADHRLKPAYYMLGQSMINLGEYEDASQALRLAIDESAPKAEYIDTILMLVESETKQENYVTALNILQNIPTLRLSQEYTAKVLSAKVKILNKMDLVETSISLLRRKIEYIADSYVRALLSVDLARCYTIVGDYKIAAREITYAMYDLPPGNKLDEAHLLLAQNYFNLESYDKCISICKNLIESSAENEITSEACRLLGDSYTKKGLHEQAALAYSQLTDSILPAENADEM